MKTVVFLDGHGFEKQNNVNLNHTCYFLRPSGQGLGSDVFDTTIKSCLKRDIFNYSPYANALFFRKFANSFIDAIFAATNNLYLIAK